MAFVKPFQSGTTTSATLDQALTSVATIHCENYSKLFVVVTASVQAFDQFQIAARAVAGGTDAIIAGPAPSGTSFTTAIKRPLLVASGDLPALSAADGWFYMDVEGIFEVDISLAFAADNGTYVLTYSLQ
jgi:hypothetical protein